MSGNGKRVLITGINGQDGSYLADILLEKRYEVHGLHRHSSVPDHLQRIEHIRDRITLHEGDVTDPSSLRTIINDVFPHEIYHEADQDHVGYSHYTPSYSVSTTVGGTVNLLEAVRANKTMQAATGAKIFLPCSATMYQPSADKLSIGSYIAPMSPYACAKAHVYHLGRFYREYHGLHIVNGVLFSHDSPRRGPSYLLQRIARSAAKGIPITITNPGQQVDIGHAREFMECAVLAMGNPYPMDWIIGTGMPISVMDIATSTFLRAGLLTSMIRTELTCRNAEHQPIASPSVTKADLGWTPTKNAKNVAWELLDHFVKG